MTIKLSELRKVKGIGKVAMERVAEHLDKLEGDKAYVSEYDEAIHINPGDLVQGDMLEVMNGIPDGSVDMILTDLPYGTTACSWDSVIDFDKMWKQYNRVIKPNGAIVLFGNQPFTTRLISSNFDNYKHIWIWDKHIPRGFQVAKFRPMSKHEDIIVFAKNNNKVNYYPIMIKRDKPVTVKNYSKSDTVSSNDIGKYNNRDKSFTYTHKNPDNIIKGKWEANSGKVHPTQKPVALLEYLIKTYTKEDEVVLDSTMGSGSTGVAAIKTNRKFIGIELDEEYFKTAEDRIKEHLDTIEKV